MGIKTYNPYTPSRRHMTGSDFSEITTSTPEKSLVVSLKKNAGRNNQGKITVRHRGGGSRRKYRIIDFKRRKDGIPATVKTIEYDPNRTANIALICFCCELAASRKELRPDRVCGNCLCWPTPAAGTYPGWYYDPGGELHPERAGQTENG